MAENVESALRKFVAPEFVFGVGARFLVARYARNLGAQRVLIVSDPGVVSAGWCIQVIESLEEQQIPYSLYTQVSPNPRDFEVMTGSHFFKQEGCNLLVVVGGGSPMDCAKGIGIVATNDENILDYEGIDQVENPIPPLICIPTTGGTSADVSQFCIVTDVRHRNKISILSKAIVPDVSLIDPETLITMPADLAAHTAFDALTHGVEAYVSNANSPITDLLALDGIHLITHGVESSIREPTNLAIRRDIMRGSLEVGLAFSNASLGIIHAMAHSLGGLLDLPHGLCNSILLPAGISFNYEAVPERFAAIATAMGLKVRDSTVKEGILDEIERLRESTGIKQRLGAVGVKPSDIAELAKKAFNDACLVTNPRAPTVDEIENLYEELL